MNRKLRRALKAVLGENGKNPESLEDIQKEYGKACAAAGELQYKITILEEELDKLNDQIRKLNKAYSEALAEQQAQAQAKASQPVPAPQEAKND